MKFGPIRAIVIDDKPTHLLAISAGLSAVGIPCMSYWYDRSVGGLSPTPSAPHKYLRLIFSDLNLANLGANPEPEALEAVIETVLKQVVAPDGGPYVLVFGPRSPERRRRCGSCCISDSREFHFRLVYSN